MTDKEKIRIKLKCLFLGHHWGSWQGDYKFDHGSGSGKHFNFIRKKRICLRCSAVEYANHLHSPI